MRSRNLMAGAIAVLLGSALSATATDIYWTGNLSGNWADAGNWQGGSLPSSADGAVFNLGTYTNQPITYSTQSIYGLTLTANTANVTLTAGGGAFNVGAAGISLAANKIFTYAGTQDLNVAGAIAFSTGSTLNFTGNSKVSFAQGVAGTGTLSFNGANIALTTGGNLFAPSTGNITLTNNAALTLAGTQDFTISSPIFLPTNTSLTVSGNANIVFAMALVGNGTLTFNGTGTSSLLSRYTPYQPVVKVAFFDLPILKSVSY